MKCEICGFDEDKAPPFTYNCIRQFQGSYYCKKCIRAAAFKFFIEDVVPEHIDKKLNKKEE